MFQERFAQTEQRERMIIAVQVYLYTSDPTVVPTHVPDEPQATDVREGKPLQPEINAKQLAAKDGLGKVY